MTKRTIISVFIAFVLTCVGAFAQQKDSLITVTGVVRNTDFDAVPYANISIKGLTIGTVTNEDGYFSLKIPATSGKVSVVVSHVGYFSTSMDVAASMAKDIKFTLNPYPNLLEEASIIGYDPETLVKTALEKIYVNYPDHDITQVGFYRETAQKGSRYTSIAEAVIDISKTSYQNGVDWDRVKILKGRSLVSQRQKDTISVKLQGGPTMSVRMDVVKNKYDLFYKEDITSYNYTFEPSTVIDQRMQYVVAFTPRIVNDRYALYRGKLYIDRETLTIMRAEYSVDMTRPWLVTDMLLRKKPSTLKFQPQSVDFVVSYRMVDDVAVLNYVRNVIKFKCDWKRKLFSSGFTLCTEMVATDVKLSPETITRKEAFRDLDIFFDKVDDFSDPDFWGDYNILEPTESLENAVGRLKRRAQ